MRQDVRETLEKEIMTLPKIAAHFGVAHSLIYRYVVDEMVVDYVKVGQAAFVDTEDLDVIADRLEKAKQWRKTPPPVSPTA